MTDIAGYQAHIRVLEARRDTLEAEVDALEEVVARLESEGLKPLVDRLRSQIGSIKKLVVAMAVAIDELTDADTAGMAELKDAAQEIVEKVEDE